MALPYRFPWVWSPAEEAVPPPPPPPPPFWTELSSTAQNWSATQARVLPRFQEIYPQDSDLGWTEKEPVD